MRNSPKVNGALRVPSACIAFFIIHRAFRAIFPFLARLSTWCGLVTAHGVCLLLCLTAHGKEDLTLEQLEFFEKKIRPVLVEHCYECHAAGSKIIQAGLRVDHRAGLLKGGDSGASIVPNEPERSAILKALRYEDAEMPPKGKLADSIIADFQAWIAMGAPDPRVADELPTDRTIDLDEGRKFWAFQPVADPQPPSVHNQSWPLDPVDRFILAKQEEVGIQPVGDADRYTWLRRVSLDLTGLPPTHTEIDAFIRDNSPHACATVVDRLLDSRAYGERWSRHWLDLTGYADMIGTSNSVFAQHAWRYRDYLIEAFNNDKPFDRFVREQIAGDLMEASTPQEKANNITATGFLMLGDVEIVEPDKPKMETDHIDTQVSKIGTVFLGMTLGCVRCHDHKFDPIGVDDYYGIAGMLRSSPSTRKIPFGVWSTLNATELPETPEQLEQRKKLEEEHSAKIASLKAEQTKLNDEKKAIVAQIAKLEKAAADDKVAGTLRVPSANNSEIKNDKTDSEKSKEAQSNPERSSRDAGGVPATKDSLTKQRDELTEKLKTLGTEIQHAEFFSSKVPQAFAMHDGEKPADMPVYIRGNPYAPGKIVPRGALRVASWKDFPEIPSGQSGRLQLADWLVDTKNPLTARVTVNRIWQKLFGEGLVRSIDYFGVRGEVPSHPELLDHLATRFMKDGWSQKTLIRSLVLSRTYRLSSANPNVAGTLGDPDNRFLWRMNRQRLDAEAIRDSILAVSGELRESHGGPALVLEVVENTGALVQKGVNPPNYTHRKPRPSQEFERTVYLPVMRNGFTNDDRVRTYFDFVNPAQIAGQRNQTVVPTQLLFLMNNDLFRKRAKSLVDPLLAGSAAHDERLNQLWIRVLGRPITSVERQEASSFLEEAKSLITHEPNKATADSIVWQELCHSLMSSNHFVFRL
ncbi:MAG: DUF1553 domain-containing protein [Pirellula sp.]|nr:DUF1553 domain-containing protein [Pirellula sp.]